MKHLLLLLLLPVFLSCSFTEEQSEKTEKASHPTLVLEETNYLLGQGGEEPISITSDKITFYSEDNFAILENFTFEQKKDGELVISGHADYGELNTSTKDMTLEGNVSILQLKENMEIQSEQLLFNPDKEEISAIGSVVVKSESGSFSGQGFKGDLKEQNYSFEILNQGWMER